MTLTAKGRRAIKPRNFVFPPTKRSPGRYPINTAARARNALARVAQHGTPAMKAKVRAAVRRRYPGIAVAGKKGKKK